MEGNTQEQNVVLSAVRSEARQGSDHCSMSSSEGWTCVPATGVLGGVFEACRRVVILHWRLGRDALYLTQPPSSAIPAEVRSKNSSASAKLNPSLFCVPVFAPPASACGMVSRRPPLLQALIQRRSFPLNCSVLYPLSGHHTQHTIPYATQRNNPTSFVLACGSHQTNDATSILVTFCANSRGLSAQTSRRKGILLGQRYCQLVATSLSSTHAPPPHSHYVREPYRLLPQRALALLQPKHTWYFFPEISLLASRRCVPFDADF